MGVTTGVTAGAVYVLSHSIHPKLSKIGHTFLGGAAGRCENYSKQHGLDGWRVRAEVVCQSVELARLTEAEIHRGLRERGLHRPTATGAQELFKLTGDEAEALVRRKVTEIQDLFTSKAIPVIKGLRAALAKEKAVHAAKVTEWDARAARAAKARLEYFVDYAIRLAPEYAENRGLLEEIAVHLANSRPTPVLMERIDRLTWALRNALGIRVAYAGALAEGAGGTEFKLEMMADVDEVEAVRRIKMFIDACGVTDPISHIDITALSAPKAKLN